MCHHSNYNRDMSHIAYITEKYYGSITKIEILKHNDNMITLNASHIGQHISM
jgi:hypothetical protein